MDFFTELLENFDQIKKRTFKVRLDEVRTEDIGSPEYEAAAQRAQEYIKQAFALGGAEIQVGEFPNLYLWVSQSGDSQGEVVLRGLTGYGAPAITLGGNPRSPESGTSSYNKFVTKFMEEGGWKQKSKEEVAQERVEAAPTKIPKFIQTLQRGLFSAAKDGIFGDDIPQINEYISKYYTPDPDTLLGGSAYYMIHHSLREVTLEKGRPVDFEFMDPDKAIPSLKAFDEAINLARKIKRGEEVSETDLEEITKKAWRNKNGAHFGDEFGEPFSMGYEAHGRARHLGTDVINIINEHITERNEEVEEGEKLLPQIPFYNKYAITNNSETVRGTVGEFFAAGAFAAQKASKGPKNQKELYKKSLDFIYTAFEKHGAGAIEVWNVQQNLDKGITASTPLTGEFQQLHKDIIKELTPRIKQRGQEIGKELFDEGIRSVVLKYNFSQTAKFIRDVNIDYDDVTHTGVVDANKSGTKSDILLEVTTPETLKNNQHLENFITPMIIKDRETVGIPIEMKTVDNIKDYSLGSTTVGAMTTKMDVATIPRGEQDEIRGRELNFLVGLRNKYMGGKGATQIRGARELNSKIKSDLTIVNKAFSLNTDSTEREANYDTIKKTIEEKQGFEALKQVKSFNTKYKNAIKDFKKDGDDKKAGVVLNSIRQNLAATITADTIQKALNNPKTVERAKGLAFLSYGAHICGGSDTEVLRYMRGVDDQQHVFFANNETINSALDNLTNPDETKKNTINQSKRTFSIKDPEGNTQLIIKIKNTGWEVFVNKKHAKTLQRELQSVVPAEIQERNSVIYKVLGAQKYLLQEIVKSLS